MDKRWNRSKLCLDCISLYLLRYTASTRGKRVNGDGYLGLGLGDRM